MALQPSLEEWAATAELPRPHRWADIEVELLARAGKPKLSVSRVLAITPLLVLMFLFYGSPWIGLAIVVGNVEANVAGWWFVVQIFFGAANLLPWLSLSFWRHDRRRREAGLLVKTGGTGVAALTAFFSMWAAPQDLYAGWAPLLTLIAGGAGLGVFVTILVASNPARGRKLAFGVRVRAFVSPDCAHHYAEARRRGLQILVEHGRAELDDQAMEKSKIKTLGAWHELDSPA